MLEKFLIWSGKVYKHPKLLTIIAIVMTIGFALFIPGMKFDNNIKTMLPPHNADLKIHDYYEDESRFGSSSLIIVGIATPDSYSLETLNYVKELKDKIEALGSSLPAKNLAKLLGLTAEEAQGLKDALDSVGINHMNYKDEMIPLVTDASKLKERFGWKDALASKVALAAQKASPAKLWAYYDQPINKTESLVNTDYVAYKDDTLIVEKLIDENDLTEEGAARLRERVKSWDVYQDLLFNKTGTFTTLFAKLNTTDIDVKSELNQGIEKILAESARAPFKTYLDGETVIEDKIARYMMQDILLLLPLVILVVLSILWLCFRAWEGVVYPSLVVLMSVVWAVGLETALGIPITVVGTALPILLVAIASAYGIHQMNHYLLDPEGDKLKVLDHNMKTVGLAITLSGITVMVGFGALISEDFVPVKNFGIFTAWGDFIGVAAALFFLPAFILVSRRPKRKVVAEPRKGWIDAILHCFVKINEKHALFALVVSVALTAVFVIGTFGVKTELNNVALFKPGETIRVADETLNENLAGTQSLNLILDSDLTPLVPRAEGKAGDGEAPDIATPEVLSKMDQFSIDVRKQFPFVQKVSSFADIMKKINLEMNGGDQAFYKIPESKDLISQYLMIFSGDTSSIMSSNHDKLRISLTMKRTSSEDVERVRTYALNYFSKDFQKENHFQLAVTGAAHLYYVGNELLVEGTYRSVIICIIIVFILLLYVLQSFWMSLIAMIPIAMTLVIDFGILGLFHIPLNAGTAMVSSVAIGIGVDYSIHYITWYRNELRKSPVISEALEATILHKGRAILYNMFVIVGGFLVLVVSKFIPLIQFGSLVAVCMITTAVGALVVVPAVIKLLARKERIFLYLGTKKV